MADFSPMSMRSTPACCDSATDAAPTRVVWVQAVEPNRLVLRIQPNEGIGLRFNAKVPGTVPRLGAVEMDFSYDDYFGDSPSTGYETLIYDCLCGDATLFKRADNIEAGWELVEPVIDTSGSAATSTRTLCPRIEPTVKHAVAFS